VCIEFWAGNIKGGDRFDCMGVGRRIILKLILKI
jgi:hypothetical protein